MFILSNFDDTTRVVTPSSFTNGSHRRSYRTAAAGRAARSYQMLVVDDHTADRGVALVADRGVALVADRGVALVADRGVAPDRDQRSLHRG